MPALRHPRVLLVDDDPVSLRFLEIALAALGCAVTAVADGLAARSVQRTAAFDLLLLDRRLPDTDAPSLLQALRGAGCAAPAIATSAELDIATREALLAAGFVDALAKPVRIGTLAQHLARHAGATPARIVQSTTLAACPPLLDDAAGLAAVGGDAATLHALRGLLVIELDALLRQGGTRDADGLAGAMHRLRAACAYCGALRLAEAAAQVQIAASDRARLPAAWRALLDACAQTMPALQGARPGAAPGAA